MYRIKAIVTRFLNNFIRKNKLLTRILFNIQIPNSNDIHWDFTTLVLKKALNEILKPHLKILEIGTGPYALLALHLYKKGYTNITATDINPDYIISCRSTAFLNNIDIEFIKCNLFSKIKEKYDVIFFNAVYIPEAVGKQMKLTTLHKCKSHWCGGKSGVDTITRFLQNAFHHLSSNGTVLLGYNPYYSPNEKILPLCRANHYKITKETKCLFLPSVVLSLERGNE